MYSSNEEGIAILREWHSEQAHLWVQFWETGKTSINGKCSIFELTDDALTLSMGHIASATLVLVLPVAGFFVPNTEAFTHLKVIDAPATIQLDTTLFTESLQARYLYWGDGWILYKLKWNL
jgi:hypothetical protein